jgi:Tachylectin
MSNFPVLTADDEGIIYAVNAANGRLEWYRDKARDGVSSYNSWVDQNGETIQKEGWGEFTHIVSGGNGVIYAVDPGGNLLFFRHMARDGTADWAYGGVGQQIGTGWGDFEHIVGGGCGILYAVNADGNLLYYRDRARDADWAYGGVGQQIGTGWGRFSSILGGRLRNPLRNHARSAL